MELIDKFVCTMVHSTMALCKFWCVYFFFFSSRRRHTRLQGDWSSDVCSSDLPCRRRQLKSMSISECGLHELSIICAGRFSGAREGGFVTKAKPVAAGGGCARRRSEERRVGEEGRSRWSPDH